MKENGKLYALNTFSSKKPPVTHWIRSSAGLRADENTVKMTKISAPATASCHPAHKIDAMLANFTD